jgi:hypothetical protein
MVNAKALIEAVEHSNLDDDAKTRLREILDPTTPTSGWVPAIALPEELSAKIEAFEVSAETKKALKAVALGVPVPEAAKLSACQDTLVLFQAAVGLGIISLKSKSIVHGHRRNAVLASQEIGKRLLEKPDDMSAMELNAIGGTATDKVRDFEGWRSVGARGEGRQLSDVIAQLGKALDGKRIGLTVEDAPPDAKAIDVTPTGVN